MEPVKATKLKRCDFAHLAATRWPLAGFKELYILAFLSLWLVTWDDQIDDDTKDSLSNDFEAAEQYRRETLYFVAQCLDLDLTEGLPRSYNDSIFVPDDPIVQSFDVIGEALRDAYTYAIGRLSASFEAATLEYWIRRIAKTSTPPVFVILKMTPKGVEVAAYLPNTTRTVADSSFFREHQASTLPTLGCLRPVREYLVMRMTMLIVTMQPLASSFRLESKAIQSFELSEKLARMDENIAAGGLVTFW
ncbi:hypothetical protein APSETT445_009211 [Aspergillus pseudonomiae]